MTINIIRVAKGRRAILALKSLLHDSERVVKGKYIQQDIDYNIPTEPRTSSTGFESHAVFLS